MSDENAFNRTQEVELVKEIGMYSIKVAITLCSGGFLVILTFLGNLKAGAPYSVDLEGLKSSLLLLLAGLVFSVLTLFISYLIAQFRLSANGPTRFDRGSPLIFLITQSGPLIVAFVFFVVGVIVALNSISP